MYDVLYFINNFYLSLTLVFKLKCALDIALYFDFSVNIY